MQQSPQELLLMAGIAERARSGRNISEQNNDIKKTVLEIQKLISSEEIIGN